MIQGYKTVQLRDYVLQPGASLPVSEMPEDMVCHVLEGTLQVTNNGNEFTAERGQVWTCNKGGTEGVRNATSEPAVMRVAHLMA